jgi:squalene-hopene/tetraprenyl-beta-curcumene cyclase
MSMLRLLSWCSVAVVALANPSRAEDSQITKAEWQKVVDKAVDYARARGQAEDGSFSKQNGIGITAVVAAGLASVGVTESDPVLGKSIAFMLSHKQPDGGIYLPGSKHANYETCLVVMALTKINANGKYDEVLKGAERYIKGLQWDETEELKKEDLAYGGAGYGSKSRPDLSNTSFLIDALKSLGRDENDEAIQRALLFVTRCQNLESSENASPYAALVDDGGFYYTVAAGGESQAGKTENGGLRSYASMTYAGLKSMIFAGVSKDDKRVQAALKFLQKNYSVEINPGMGTSGLFYYYHTMAKALDAFGVEEFESTDGKHHWRSDIFNKLASTQNEDGSWVNKDSRWLEGDPNLVSGYSLLTLSFLKPAK